MANNIREHWDEIREVREELRQKVDADGAIYLMSLKRRKMGVTEGQVSVCGLQVAALMLAQETHRLATPEEIVAFKAEQERAGKAIRQQKINSESKVQINLGDQLAAILAQTQLQRAQVAEQPAAATTSAPSTFE